MCKEGNAGGIGYMDTEVDGDLIFGASHII